MNRVAPLLGVLLLCILGCYNAAREAHRSSQWVHARHAWLVVHPGCAACGKTIDPEVHHIKPFHDHPELELDPTNFITLCGWNGCQAHFRLGHKYNFADSNLNVVADAKREHDELTRNVR